MAKAETDCYQFQHRDSQTSEWRNVPVTWLSADDDTVRAAIQGIKEARRLVAQLNQESSQGAYRIVRDPRGWGW